MRFQIEHDGEGGATYIVDPALPDNDAPDSCCVIATITTSLHREKRERLAAHIVAWLEENCLSNE